MSALLTAPFVIALAEAMDTTSIVVTTQIQLRQKKVG